MKTKSTFFIFCFFISTASAQITTEALLDTIQHTAFSYFWNAANPANGLIKDRLLAGAPCSIASEGFGLTAICIGVDHGWVSRNAAKDRVLTALKTFWYSSQGGGTSGTIGNFGLFYHMLDMDTGKRTWSSELSTIDTALLLAGIIDVKQYYTGTDSVETLIRNFSDSIYYRMNWDLMRNFNPGILMGWTPEHGFSDQNGNAYGEWVGYNEATLMYIFALGSPTHPVDYTAWQKWTDGYNANLKTQYGYNYVNFPPLFGHQYSHCWIDFRSIADDWMKAHHLNYFENSRLATLAQRAYSIDNPGKFVGYSDSLWGITASDSPYGYKARGAPPAQDDDGTIAPTAPVSSIAFAPEVVIPVIHKMWNTYGSKLWTQYGFRDAFNLTLNWWDNDIIGIDQGPMIIMIENYRNQSVWNRFMKNPDVQRGLAAAKFTTVTGVGAEKSIPKNFSLSQNYPNPFNPTTIISYQLPKNSFVSIKVYDLLGKEIARLVDETQSAGMHTISFDATHLPSGIYFYTLRSGQFTETKKMMLLR
ncbi:MAG: glucoamylase family protein [Bacteroidota bacterium]|nr:glucoamylase family protein [Bacteroidota bacterium]